MKIVKIILTLFSISQLTCYVNGQKINVDIDGNINFFAVMQDSLVLSNSETIYTSLDPGIINKRQYLIINLDSVRNINWYQLFGHECSQALDIASDKSGNVYLAGVYIYHLPLDPEVSLYSTINEFVIVKYDSKGNYQWHRTSSGTVDSYNMSLEIDSIDNLYFSAIYRDYFTFNDSDTIYNSSEFSDHSVFISKFDSSGSKQWLSQLYGSADWVFDLEINSSGESFLSGQFSDKGPAWFGNDTILSDGDWDAFIAKIDSDGQSGWIKKATATGSHAIGRNIAVNDQGKPTMVGGFTNSIRFQNIPPLVSNSNNPSLFIVKYDSAGVEQWATKGAPMNPTSERTIISMDSKGNHWLASPGPFQIEAFQIEGNGSFLVKFDSLGRYQCHIENIGGATDIFINNRDEIYITGSFTDSLNMCDRVLYGSNENYYITKFDNECKMLWTEIILNPMDYIGSVDSEKKHQVRVYPNPTVGPLHIEVSEKQFNKAYLRVYSISGSLLIWEALDSPTKGIDISSIPKGIYFISIEINNDRMVEKLIRN